MMQKAYRIEGDAIVINRELTDLDLFVRDFLEVLKRHSDYLIVSGFVSISTGRTRGTEDVDVLVPVMEQARFDKLLNDLKKSGFWCYQGETAKEVYPYIKDRTSIRFARTGGIFPNMEFIPIDETKKAKFFEFKHPQKMRVHDFEFNVPPIEFEILYKEIILKSKKDIEDARHLRAIFSDLISQTKFKEYEPIIRQELR
jgi:hypothetical protein